MNKGGINAVKGECGRPESTLREVSLQRELERARELSLSREREMT